MQIYAKASGQARGAKRNARALAAVVPGNGAKFLLTHNYAGWTLIRQARGMVAEGGNGAWVK